MNDKKRELAGEVTVLVGTGGIHTQADVMCQLAQNVLRGLPNDAPGRSELQQFITKMNSVVQLLDEACEELGEPGNPMYRPYTLKP